MAKPLHSMACEGEWFDFYNDNIDAKTFQRARVDLVCGIMLSTDHKQCEPSVDFMNTFRMFDRLHKQKAFMAFIAEVPAGFLRGFFIVFMPFMATTFMAFMASAMVKIKRGSLQRT